MWSHNDKDNDGVRPKLLRFKIKTNFKLFLKIFQKSIYVHVPHSSRMRFFFSVRVHYALVDFQVRTVSLMFIRVTGCFAAQFYTDDSSLTYWLLLTVNFLHALVIGTEHKCDVASVHVLKRTGACFRYRS